MIDIGFCFSSLSNNELRSIVRGLNEVPFKDKENNLELLCKIAQNKNLRPIFKEYIKKKYMRQWCYLKDNIDTIMPIDYQSFFATTIDPSIIYENHV